MSDSRKRKWYEKKTNWAILIGIASQVMPLIPVVAPFAPLVLKIAAVFGVYGIADRAGKPPESNYY